ncbi:MAG: CmpA/NrtA family ABC transporter substrate-binding protein [Stagnimonas sp.]|nr:CmpA/NrtA family ABC transporter substrate-binding protein [Stagnimonas sp.]
MSKPALECPQLTLGVIPLTDSAPLVVAEAAGFFAAEGLDVALATVRSWAAMRDKLASGRIEGATLLAPMPLAAAFGLDPVATPILTVKALSQGGSGFCVTPELHARLLEHGATPHATPLEWAAAMRRLVEAGRGSRTAPTLAHVYPYSTHHYELRYWLASVGLHPELDLNLVTVPPPLMVQQLEAGRIDGAWVGSPWPALAAARGAATVLFDKRQFWNGGPEKVFAVAQPWAEAHPETLAALLRALIAAGRWLDDPANHAQAAHWLQATLMPDVSPELLARELKTLRFHAGLAGFPWRSHSRWLLEQMRRWKHLPASADVERAAASCRSDLYRSVARALGEPLPLSDEKPEGVHDLPYLVPGESGALQLPADRIMGGMSYEATGMA